MSEQYDSWLIASFVAHRIRTLGAVVKVETDTDHASRGQVICRRRLHVTMAAKATKYCDRCYRPNIHTESERRVGVGRGCGRAARKLRGGGTS
jgi:hypothetical protein